MEFLFGYWLGAVIVAGKTDEIAEHCKTDVELVRRVYQRITGEA